MKKLFTLLTLLVVMVTSTWADEVSANRTVSGTSRETCTWTIVNVSVSKNTNLGGDGLYFTNGNTSIIGMDGSAVKISKLDQVLYVEVPSASSTGTISLTCSGNQSSRYMYLETYNETTNSQGRIVMNKSAQSANFATGDVININGGYYIKLTRKNADDYKLTNISVTLTSGESYPYYPSLKVTPTSVTLNATTGTPTPTANITLTGADLNEMDASSLEFASSVAGLSIDRNTITATDGTIAEANRTYTITYAPTTNVDATNVVLTILAKKSGTTIATATVTVNYSSNISDDTAPVLDNASSNISEGSTYKGGMTNSSIVLAFDDLLTDKSDVAATFNGKAITGVASGNTITFSNVDLSTSGAGMFSIAAGAFTNEAGIANEAITINFTVVAASNVQTWDFTTLTKEDIIYNVDFWNSEGQNKTKLDKNTDISLPNNLGYDLCNGIKFGRTDNDIAGGKLFLIEDYGIRNNNTKAYVKIPTSVDKYVKITYTSASNSKNVGFEITSGATLIGGDLTHSVANKSSETYYIIVKATSNTIMLTVDGNDEANTVLMKVEEVDAIPMSETATSYTPVAANGVDVNITRTLSKDYYNTICLPFDVTITDSPLAGADVQEFSSVDGTTLKFTAVSTTMEAGVPYLVKPTADVVNPTFTSVDVKAVAAATVTKANAEDKEFSFKGTYTTVTLNTDKTHQFLNTSTPQGFSYPSDAAHATMKGLRAYFVIPADVISASRSLEIDIDGISTGINIVNGEGLKVNGSDVYYDLQGRRVLYPTKGLYIVNGKKVVIK